MVKTLMGISADAILFLVAAECINTLLDLIFVVDDSGSICDNDPSRRRDMNGNVFDCNNWSFVKSFIRRIVSSLTVGQNDTRVALVRFSDRIDVIFRLDRYVTWLHIV